MASEWPGFYAIQEVSRLTQVPLRTLYEWQERGIIAPALEMDLDNGRVLLGYTYAQVTIIRIIRSVRERQLDFRAASLALMHLYNRLGPPDRGWAGERVYVVGDTIYADRPDEWDVTAATLGGQKVETRLFGDLFEELRQLEEDQSILVPADFRDCVTIDPDIMGGEPVVRGTRIPTSVLAALHRAGKSASQIARMYGRVSRSVIEKAIAYESYLDASPSAT